METKETPISKQRKLSPVNKIIIATVATVILVTLLIVGGNIYTQNNYINWKKDEEAKAKAGLDMCEHFAYEIYLEGTARNCTSQMRAWGITNVTYSKEDIRRIINVEKGSLCFMDVDYKKLQENTGKEYKTSLDNCLKKYPQS